MSTYIASRIDTVKPFLSAVTAMIIAGLLIVLDYFVPNVEPQIIAGLWVILVVSIFVVIAQIAYTEKAFSRQLVQLLAQKERLSNEIKYRLWAEEISS